MIGRMTCQQMDFDALLSERDDHPELVAMQLHVEQCDDCRQELENAAGSNEWWDECRDALRDSAAAHASDESRPCATVSANAKTADASVDFELMPPSHPEMLGRLGRYEIEQFLGRGGMGLVFKGFDSELNRPVAVKVLAPHLAGNGLARQRFAREARAAASIVHEHVVAIHDVQATAEVPYLVMQYVPGTSLQSYVERHGALEPREAVRIALQIAAGLEAAHAQGVIHRDIKPANIMLENELGRVIITDFGLAQAADDYSLTRTGTLAGTPHYMSPEQADAAPVDGRTDLFSLGSVMYFMATGRPPFRAHRALGVLHRICHHEPTSPPLVNPDVPAPLARCIEQLLAKQPGDRPQSAGEVREMLAAYLAHLQQPTLMPVPPSLRRPSVGRRLPLAGGLVAAAALFVLAASSLDNGPEAEPDSSEPSSPLTVTGEDAWAAERTSATSDFNEPLMPPSAFDRELAAVRDAITALEQPGTNPLLGSSLIPGSSVDSELDALYRAVSELEQTPF